MNSRAPARDPLVPARAEGVGSLLRSDALKEQFAKAYGHGIYATSRSGERLELLRELDAVARGLTPELVSRQIDAGLDVVTDGELRRGLFTNSLLDGVEGIQYGDPAASDTPYDIPIAVDRLKKVSNPARKEAEELVALTAYPKKITFPAPSYFYFKMFLEFSPQAYANRDAFVADVVAVERQLVEEVINAGIDHVQFDFPLYPMLVDPDASSHAEALGETPDSLLAKALAVDAAILEGLPPHVTKALHLCRGNTMEFFKGSIGPIAEELFALPYDRFLFEWENVERVGTYEPIALVPKGKIMVMGLVSTKTPVVEDEDEIVRRLDEASKYLDIAQLAISPQCGFASAWFGHKYREDVQWRKLELVGRVAERVWGSEKG